MLIEEITMPEFIAGLAETQTVLIPFGATEEHGPHLPLGTDTFEAADVCRLLAGQRKVFVAPAVPYGVCRSTGDHPGTISLTTETLKALAIDLVRSLYRQGLRNVVILSGHAGGTHNAALLDAGEVLLRELPELRIAVASEYALAFEAGKGLIETPGDSHAGEIETSRMLATRPRMVKGTAAAERSCFPAFILVRDKRRCWPGGVAGDPAKASAEKGRQLEALVVSALGRLVEELEESDIN
ncbi:MAG: creatininase family protein [Desulfuromonadales bacterium]|nr:creatininase family protein [Desulfuromonadales bacterium]